MMQAELLLPQEARLTLREKIALFKQIDTGGVPKGQAYFQTPQGEAAPQKPQWEKQKVEFFTFAASQTSQRSSEIWLS